LAEEGKTTRLSPRERQLVRLAAAGRTDKEICRELGVSLPTVRTHWTRLRDKLDVVTRTQAVAAAMKQAQAARGATGAARLLDGVDLSGIGFWVWDPATNEIRPDQECRLLFGLPGDEQLSLNNFLAHLPPPERGEMLALLQRARSGNPVAPLTHRADPASHYAKCLRTVALAPPESEAPMVLLASVRWVAFAA
jgi:DNA-binding CsgD family transcriptional regulator